MSPPAGCPRRPPLRSFVEILHSQLVLLALLVLPGLAPSCRPAGKPAATTPGGGGGDGLAARLRARAGEAPLYVAAGSAGVVLASADGAVRHVLLEGPARDVTIDAARELVWAVAGGRLVALDLREAAPAPVTIVEGVPDGVEVHVVHLAPDEAQDPWGAILEIANPDVTSSHVDAVLVWGARQELRVSVFEGADFGWWYEGTPAEERLEREAAAAGAGAKLVGAAWLARAAARPARPAPATTAAAPASQPAPVAVPPRFAADSEEGDGPGEAVAFGPYRLVTVAVSCGDFCYRSCLVLDAAAGRWAIPPDTSRWLPAEAIEDAGACGDFRIDPRGRAMLVGGDGETPGQVCALGGACRAIADGEPVGWLDGGEAHLVPHPKGPPGE